VNHVAQVDAYAEADALVLRHHRLALGDAPLDEHGAANRVDHACELDQGAVAHELDYAPLILGDERVDELLAVPLEALERALLVALHQARVTNHVRRQDGGEPSLDPRCRHGRPLCDGR
jgi:hypothetical protein